MTSPPPPPPPPPTNASPSEILRHLLDILLPLLLLSSLSVTSLLSRWRLLNSKLSHLRSVLAAAADADAEHHHPLLLHLLPSLLSTLQTLASLSSRCSETTTALLRSKLLLQSDLDIASNSLSLHIRDLEILLGSGLLRRSADDSSSAIVLPIPGPSSSKADVVLFVKDVFARIQIGALDLKQKALDSLRELIRSDPAKISLVIARDGDVSALVRLLDPMNHSLVRDQAVEIVSVLATASDASRRAVFEEGALGPLLRLLEAGSVAVKEHAATATEAIAADASNAWAVSAYGGVGVLVAACGPGGGSPAVRALSAGSLKNVASVEDLRVSMVEEGAIPVMIDLVGSGTDLARKNAAVVLWYLASEGGEEVRASIFREGGLQSLMQIVLESKNLDVLEHGLRAMQALSTFIPAARAMACSSEFFVHLAELIRTGNIQVQQTSASLLTSLSPKEEIRRSMAECMPSLIKMLELPKPVSAQEIAAEALACLLSARPNRIEFSRDLKSMTKLVQMLDPRREEICKKFPVSVVLALAASGGCRKRLNELGCCQQLQKLVDGGDVTGAKRALKLIAGSRLKNLFSLSWRE